MQYAQILVIRTAGYVAPHRQLGNVDYGTRVTITRAISKALKLDLKRCIAADALQAAFNIDVMLKAFGSMVDVS